MSIRLGGTPYSPSIISESPDIISVEHQAWDGTRTLIVIAKKRKWDLGWIAATDAVKVQLEALLTSASAIQIVTEKGLTFYGYIVPGSFKADGIVMGDNTLRWKVNLTFKEG